MTHSEILERLALPCRTQKDHFVDTSRLEAIRDILKDGQYIEHFNDNGVCSFWSKKPLHEIPRDIILVSAHIDIVPDIKNPFSTLSEEGIYEGTYDNLVSNAVLTILMDEYDMPDNVVFAFTGEEETGRCIGAKSVAQFLTSLGKNLTCIALDVTYEGFDENVLFSFENCTQPRNYEKETPFVDEMIEHLLATENEQSFCVVRANKEYAPSNIENKYLSRSYGMYDEAFAYRDVKKPAFSFCIPCDGSMHSDRGLKIKEPVFEGYLLSLAGLLYSLTRTNLERIEEIKEEKDRLLERAKEIVIKKPVSYYSGSYYSSPHSSVNGNIDWDSYWYNMSYVSSFDGYKDADINELFPDEDDPLTDLMRYLCKEATYWTPDAFSDFIDCTEIPPEHMELFDEDEDGSTFWEIMEIAFHTIHGDKMYGVEEDNFLDEFAREFDDD